MLGVIDVVGDVGREEDVGGNVDEDDASGVIDVDDDIGGEEDVGDDVDEDDGTSNDDDVDIMLSMLEVTNMLSKIDDDCDASTIVVLLFPTK